MFVHSGLGGQDLRLITRHEDEFNTEYFDAVMFVPLKTGIE